MKQFLVIGLGSFGFNVAVELVRQGHQVTAIDADRIRIDEIKELVTEAVIADVTDRNALAELVSPEVETAVLGLGESFMEATVLAIVHLRKLGVKNILVKAMNELRGEVYLTVGATRIIYPEKETASRLARVLTIPALIDQISLAPEYSIIELALPDDYVGTSLRELKMKQKFGVEVIAVKDVLRDSLVLTPPADSKLGPDTALIIIGKNEDIERLKRFE